MNNHLRNNFDEIKAWAYEDEQDKDTLHLSNLLKRKTMLATLPHINDFKLKLPKKHFKKLSNIDFAQSKKQSKQSEFVQLTKQQSVLSPSTYKAARQKTQGFSHTHYTNSNRKRQLIEAIPEQPISPVLTNIRLTEQLSAAKQKAKRSTIMKSSSCEAVKVSKYCRTEWPDLQKLHLFPKQQLKSQPRQSYSKHKNIENISMKRSKTKLYVRLNTLEMVHDSKKNPQEEVARGVKSRQTISKQSLTQKRQIGFIEPEFLPNKKTKSHSKLQLAVIEKMNQRFKQTFTKQDIFNRKKTKMHKISKIQASTEFNDKSIFSNSVYAKREDTVNSSLHSKIQLLKNIYRPQITRN